MTAQHERPQPYGMHWDGMGMSQRIDGEEASHGESCQGGFRGRIRVQGTTERCVRAGVSHVGMPFFSETPHCNNRSDVRAQGQETTAGTSCLGRHTTKNSQLTTYFRDTECRSRPWCQLCVNCFPVASGEANNDTLCV
jgi:hypothetical protein